VRPGDGGAPAGVHLGLHGGVNLSLTGGDGAAVHDQPRHRRLHIGDVDGEPVAPDPAGVGELPTPLGVERGAVEHDLHLGARAGGRHAHAVDDEADHAPLGDEVGVAEELAGAGGVEHGAVDRGVAVPGLALEGIGLGAGPLFLHQ
jgi:hypothetical protein